MLLSDPFINRSPVDLSVQAAWIVADRLGCTLGDALERLETTAASERVTLQAISSSVLEGRTYDQLERNEAE